MSLGLFTRYGLSIAAAGTQLPSDPDGIWLESLFITADDDEAITAWADASTREYDLEHLGDVLRFRTNVTPSGAPVVRSEGYSRMVGATRWRDDEDEAFTWFVVVGREGAETFRVLVGATSGSAFDSTGPVLFLPFDNSGNAQARHTRSDNQTEMKFGSGLNDGAFRVITVKYDPAAGAGEWFKAYIGTEEVASRSGAVAASDAPDIELALFGESHTTNFRMPGDVPALLGYRSALTDAHRELVVAYLTERYITAVEGGGTGGGATGEYGITSFSTPTTTTTNQAGWQFTVGGDDLTVDRLRVWIGTTGDETLRLWRVSDQELLASVEVSAESGRWVEADLSASVTLAAGQGYVVTTRRTLGTSRTVQYPLASGTTFNSALTYVQARFINGDGFPTSTIAGRVYGIADIRWPL